jgi:hypothetical protein
MIRANFILFDYRNKYANGHILYQPYLKSQDLYKVVCCMTNMCIGYSKNLGYVEFNISLDPLQEIYKVLVEN